MEQRLIGTRQAIVTYRSQAWKDTAGIGLSQLLLDIIADDAEARAADGWLISTWDTLLSGFTGTTANVLFDSGGGYATDVAVTVIYSHA